MAVAAAGSGSLPATEIVRSTVSGSLAVSIMVVTEDDNVAVMLQAALQQADEVEFNVHRERTLEDAAAKLVEQRCDLVILDLTVPRRSADRAISFVRDHAAQTAVVTLVTGAGDEVMQAVRAGAHGILMRQQADAGIVLAMVRSALVRRQIEVEDRHRLRGLQLAVCGSNDGFWDWDLTSGVVTYSGQWNRVLGYPELETTGDIDFWLAQVHSDDLSLVRKHVSGVLERGERHLDMECRMRSAGGGYRWVLIRGVAERGADGRPVRLAGFLSDIHQRKAVEDQLRHDALHDGLTGLPNRGLILDRIDLALARLERSSGAQFAILYVDLDDFKRINDCHGHAVGDVFLVATAQRMTGMLRPADSVARLGGDEFVVLIGDVKDGRSAGVVAERVRELISEPQVIDGHEVAASASIGIALSTSGYTSAQAMLRDADLAMYRAKALGGARSQVFDPLLHTSVMALLRLENELRRSIEKHDFVMHYQPIVSLAGGRLVGFEALVRWQHPKRGLVSPAQFIAVAEQTGLIRPLGWWVIRAACAQIRSWQQRFPRQPALWMSVNMAAALFLQNDMIDRLIEILEQNGLDPAALRVELTENVVTDHGDTAVSKLQELRALGVRLSIDDFGAGVSSLSYMDRFRYDVVKLDPSFIHQISQQEEEPHLLATILDLADRLGIGVIAEGVETEDQARRLRQLRCPQGQGFWFARPVDADGAERLITASPSWWGGG